MKKLTPDKWRSLLNYFVADADSLRPVLMKPFEQDGYVCATDTHVLLRVAKKYITDDYSTEQKTPNVANVVPEQNPIFAISANNLRDAFVRCGIDYNVMNVDCPYCDDQYEVEWEFTDSDGDKHTKWDTCPCCDGSGSIPNGSGHYLEVGECAIHAHFMLLLYRTMVELGIDKVKVSKGDRQQFLFGIAEGIDIVIMPAILKNRRSKGVTKLKTTRL